MNINIWALDNVSLCHSESSREHSSEYLKARECLG